MFLPSRRVLIPRGLVVRSCPSAEVRGRNGGCILLDAAVAELSAHVDEGIPGFPDSPGLPALAKNDGAGS